MILPTLKLKISRSLIENIRSKAKNQINLTECKKVFFGYLTRSEMIDKVLPTIPSAHFKFTKLFQVRKTEEKHKKMTKSQNFVSYLAANIRL